MRDRWHRRRLLVGGERHDDIAIRHEFVALQTDQGFDESRVPVLHVDGAASVKPSVLLGQFEWIDRPILGFGLHYVQMTQEQDGVAGMLAAVANDQIALGGRSGGAIRTTSPAEKPRSTANPGWLWRLQGSVCMCGIYLHQGFQHVAGQLPVGRGR